MIRRRILVTPREIAGVASGLQHVLTERGQRVDVLLRWSHPFGYDVTPFGSRLLRRLAAAVLEEERAQHPRLQRGVSLMVRIALLPLIAVRYRAVVFIGPDTLLRGGLDRRLLRRCGVRIVTVFCGSEARPPYLDGWYARASSSMSLDDTRTAVTRSRERVQRAERDSTYVVTHAGCAQFQQQPFLDWTFVGFAQRPGVNRGEADEPLRSTPRLLHAPSDPQMKGTHDIRSAVAQVRSEGLDVDYLEITGRPNAEVQGLLRTADLVVDQLYSDYVLPGFASEAARAGVAVLVFGYAAGLVESAAQRTAGPTEHYAHPTELLPRLRRYLVDAMQRAEVADSLHDFVTSGHWSPAAIGERWERILMGTVDADWFDQPGEIVYPFGCAVSAEDAAAFLRRYLDRYGVAALELDHHPALISALRTIAGR
jgi:hypothetical protein